MTQTRIVSITIIMATWKNYMARLTIFFLCHRPMHICFTTVVKPTKLLLSIKSIIVQPLLWIKWESYNTVSVMVTADAAKSLQSCPSLCDPIDGSPPDSPVPGILQARTLEWVAIFFSNTWKWKVKVKSLSRARLLATPWTAAYQAPPSMEFSRQEYWSGVPLPSPEA